MTELSKVSRKKLRLIIRKLVSKEELTAEERRIVEMI